MNHHFSRVHVGFWLGIEQCSNRRRFLVPDESGPRYCAWHTYQKPAPKNGVDLWRRFLERVSWVLVSADRQTCRSNHLRSSQRDDCTCARKPSDSKLQKN